MQVAGSVLEAVYGELRNIIPVIGEVVTFVTNAYLGSEHEESEEVSDRAELYADRKRARLDRDAHPREFDPSDSRTFVSGSPLRERVGVQRVHRLPRNMSAMHVVLEQWTPEDWLAHVRVGKHLFLWILQQLDGHFVDREYRTGGKPVRPAWCQLGAVLSWLGGARPVDIYNIWGMRKTAFLRYRRRIIPAIVEVLGKESIRFPDKSEYDTQSKIFAQWCKFDGVLGAIDGIIIPVQLPTRDLRQIMFCERKNVYGLNVQAVAKGDCSFSFVSASHFASVHDGRAAKETELWQHLEDGLLRDGDKQFYLLGDNAYSLRSFMLRPWKGRHEPGSRADSFNFYLSAARATIERAFGQVVLTFPILRSGIVVRNLDDAVNSIQCCFIIHNIRKLWSEGTCGAFPTTTPQASQLRDEIDAIVYVQQMGDDRAAERLTTDRKVAQETDALVGKATRHQLAWWLVDHDYCRPGYPPLPDIPCPDETCNGIEV